LGRWQRGALPADADDARPHGRRAHGAQDRLRARRRRPQASSADAGLRRADSHHRLRPPRDVRPMSTATLVPETRDLSGEDAWTTLGRTGRRRLLADAFLRMRVSDGFSHARSLAFMTSLVAVQGVLAM